MSLVKKKFKGVKMLDIKDLHPIGIGTWTISKANCDKDIKGLMYSFEKGQNSIECNASYLAGESLDVVADFIRQINREKTDWVYKKGKCWHQLPNQDPLGKEKYTASYGTVKETMKID